MRFKEDAVKDSVQVVVGALLCCHGATSAPPNPPTSLSLAALRERPAVGYSSRMRVQ
jgi:hypothetical protein